MPPLAGDAVGAGQDMAVNDDAGTSAGADDDPEYHRRTGSGAIRGFREGETVGVIADPQLALQQGLQVLKNRLAVEVHRIGVLEQAGGPGNGARRADADRSNLPERSLRLMHQIGNCLQRAGVIALRGRCAPTQEFTALVIQSDDLDFAIRQDQYPAS